MVGKILMEERGDELQLDRSWDVWVSVRTAGGVPRVAGGFSTVGDMWRLMNNLPAPSRAPVEANICQFQSGVHPTWEDERNERGGRWMFSVASPRDADVAWRNLYVALSGETLDPKYDVVGIIMARRRNYTRFSVWTRDKDDEEAVLAVGVRIRAAVAAKKLVLEYQDHGAAYDQYRYTM
jgi:translation initiation factor 4E